MNEETSFDTSEDIKDHVVCLCNYIVEAPDNFHNNILTYLLSLRNAWFISMLTIQDSCSVPLHQLFDIASKEKNSQHTSTLLSALLYATITSTFHKINVHGAMTQTEITNELKPALVQARKMLDVYSSMIRQDFNVESNNLAESATHASIKISKPYVTVS